MRRTGWPARGHRCTDCSRQVPFRRGPATGSAILDGALAYFELRTVSVHPAATHLIVVGEVLAMGSDASPADAPDPLVHFGSELRRLAP